MRDRSRIIGIFIIIAFILGLTIGLYGKFLAFADYNQPLKIWAQNDNGNYHTLVVHDEETGVEYVVVSITTIASANPNVSIAITPRLSKYSSTDYYRTK